MAAEDLNLREIPKVLVDTILGSSKSFLSDLFEFFRFRPPVEELEEAGEATVRHHPQNQSERLACGQGSKTQPVYCKQANSQTQMAFFLDSTHFPCCTSLQLARLRLKFL